MVVKLIDVILILLIKLTDVILILSIKLAGLIFTLLIKALVDVIFALVLEATS